MASAVVVCALAACDPLYGVGARQYLTPAPSRADSARVARKDAGTPPYLGTRNGPRPALEVIFNWIGMAGNVPTQEQEAMVRATTALVRQLRAACLPDVAEAVECVAGGLGRQRVCLTAR